MYIYSIGRASRRHDQPLSYSKCLHAYIVHVTSPM